MTGGLVREHQPVPPVLTPGMTNGRVMIMGKVWRYRGVTIERSRVTGYYVARTTRGLTADTLAGMRELIREYPPES